MNCAKGLNRLWTRVGQRMHKFNRIRQGAVMGGHIAATWRTTELCVYGGDAPYVKLYCPLVIFGHAHLVTQIAERFKPNTVLWAFHTIQPSSCKYSLLLSLTVKEFENRLAFGDVIGMSIISLIFVNLVNIQSFSITV